MPPKSPEKHERLEPVLVKPAIESFFSSSDREKILPTSVTENPEFIRQVDERKELNQKFDTIIACLPRADMPLKEAVLEGYITEKEVADFYASFAPLLEDPDYRRVLLYTPFEFLPESDWKPDTEELCREAEYFRTAYMQAWKELFAFYDVRANFVDGDALEDEIREGDHIRVVKAAHLIPKLVEKGFMTVEEVVNLMEEGDDEIQRSSIADTFGVLSDLGYINESEQKRMRESKDWLVRNLERLINIKKTDDSSTSSKDPVPVDYETVQERLVQSFADTDAEIYVKTTPGRTKWLKSESKRKAVETAGEDIRSAIEENRFTSEMTVDFLKPDADIESQIAYIEGVRKAIETINNDKTGAEKRYAEYHEMLISLWQQGASETREALTKTFSRLHNAGIVSKDELDELGIFIPKLAGPFSENLRLIEKEMAEIQRMAMSIAEHPNLSEVVYPAALVHGSLIKGYGKPSSDIDISIFIRPGTPLSSRGKIKEELKEVFVHEKIQGDVVQFWLKEENESLKVFDFDEPEMYLAKSYWVDVLLESVWAGEENVIIELQKKLFPAYFSDSEKTSPARSLYLDEMERDLLQYRLMHRGYSEFYPPCGGIHTSHSDEIDGESMFWDSGYRQVATKLFLSKVFLPKIS